jgi:LmbE family N-acetylglucosaminyl deacetylase
MVSLGFKRLKTVLCLGAHADDIEIGCGGTVLRLIQEQPHLEVLWVVFSAKARRKREAQASARGFLKGAGRQTVLVKGFRDGFFPVQSGAIKEFFEALKKRIQPDLVFTHYREDRHQDHRVISDLAWNTFRDHAILEYEIPKYDGDLGNPNLYVPLSKELCRRKVEQLCAFFQTQSNKHWFSADTFLALMRLRGVECASKTHYAEALFARKLVW